MRVTWTWSQWKHWVKSTKSSFLHDLAPLQVCFYSTLYSRRLPYSSCFNHFRIWIAQREIPLWNDVGRWFPAITARHRILWISYLWRSTTRSSRVIMPAWSCLLLWGMKSVTDIRLIKKYLLIITCKHKRLRSLITVQELLSICKLVWVGQTEP